MRGQRADGRGSGQDAGPDGDAGREMLLLSLKEAHAEANRAKAALAQCRSELADRKQVPRAACRLHPPTARVLGAPKASASPSSQASARQGPAAEGDADEVRRTPAGAFSGYVLVSPLRLPQRRPFPFRNVRAVRRQAAAPLRQGPDTSAGREMLLMSLSSAHHDAAEAKRQLAACRADLAQLRSDAAKTASGAAGAGLAGVNADADAHGEVRAIEHGCSGRCAQVGFSPSGPASTWLGQAGGADAGREALLASLGEARGDAADTATDLAEATAALASLQQVPPCGVRGLAAGVRGSPRTASPDRGNSLRRARRDGTALGRRWRRECSRCRAWTARRRRRWPGTWRPPTRRVLPRCVAFGLPLSPLASLRATR